MTRGGTSKQRRYGARASRVPLLVFLAGVLLVAIAQSPQAVARTGFASTVTVLVYDASGDALGLGSGFVVDDERVVTNAHVIAGAASVLVRPIGGAEPLEATRIAYFDQSTDLAVLVVPALSLPALDLRAEDAPSVGDAVFAVGSPLGLEGTFTQGIVSGYRSIEDMSLIQITAPVSPGSSGGPVLNLQGRVVGVAVGTYADGQNLNFAIPVSALEALLSSRPADRAVDSLATESASVPAGGETGRDLVDAIDFGGVALSPSGRFSFSTRNNLPRRIQNVDVAVTFFDTSDFPLSTQRTDIRGPIEAGLAARSEFRLEQGIQELITDRYDPTSIQTRIEFRVLTFEYAD